MKCSLEDFIEGMDIIIELLRESQQAAKDSADD